MRAVPPTIGRRPEVPLHFLKTAQYPRVNIYVSALVEGGGGKRKISGTENLEREKIFRDIEGVYYFHISVGVGTFYLVNFCSQRRVGTAAGVGGGRAGRVPEQQRGQRGR